MKRAFLVAVLLAGLLHAVLPAETEPPDALKFFKNYFVTGSYAVGGVGLQGTGVGGTATGSICIGMKDGAGNCVSDPTNEVPPNADVVAAFLYWQAVTKDDGTAGRLGVTFNGMPLSSVDPLTSAQGSFGSQLGVGTPPCWSGGGGTGSSGGAHKTYTYRADVLRFLTWDETTGKLAVNGAHQVQLPDGGDVAALGASLVVVYSDPARPFSAIVLYDGNYTMDQSTERMDQSIKWFYDGTASGRLTHIVGSGQANKSEILRFNGNAIATNPFKSAQGPGWDNFTYVLNASNFVPPVPDPLAKVTTSVDHQGFNSFDCLTWAAVVYETPVVDSDEDGLLNVWEQPRGSGAYPDTDPSGQTLPNLAAMHADPLCKDVFLEINYLKTDTVTSYGGVLKPKHSHLPTHQALKLMGDAFNNAHVDNAPGCTRVGGQGYGKGILLHVDVGDYPAGSPSDLSKNADAYIIRDGDVSGLARGGEFIDEAATTLDPVTNAPCTTTDPPEACQFSAYPGTVGWKTGFRFFRDELVSAAPPPLTATGEDPCDWPYDPATGQPDTGPGGACERRFDRVRKNMFRYALFAHAIGLPKSEIPTDPAFRIPQTISGVGDLPGGDFLVALGAFSDHLGEYVGDPAAWTAFPTGTPFMVASTAFHEMGHGFGLGHGGPLSDANCKPVYTSTMNYLYQLRGLLDDHGKRNLNFSLGTNPSVNEEALADNNFPGVRLSYRIGWYAPLAGSYRESSVPTPIPANSRCPGTPKAPGEEFIRFDAPDTLSSIDWNANGTIDEGYSLDVNFDGRTKHVPGGASGQFHQDYDDWSNIRLNQLASRRSAGGLFRLLPKPADCLDDPCLVLGPLSLDANSNDYPASDYARYDTGRSYYGRSYYGRSYYGADLSRGDLGLGDYGRSYYGRSYYGRSYYGRSYYGRSYYGRSYYGRSYYGRSYYGTFYDDQPFTGSGDRGRSYLGGGDLSLGDPNNPGGELDHETATWNSPPAEFGACVIGIGGCSGDPDDSFKVKGFWTEPTEGGVRFYQFYRVQAESLQSGQEWEPVGGQRDPRDSTLWVDCATVGRYDPDNPSRRCFAAIDDFLLVKGLPYIYFTQATHDDGLTGDPSDHVKIYGPNHPPVANAQSVTTAEDTTLGIVLSGSDVDGDDLTYTVVAGPSRGGLVPNVDGSFTYTPGLNYHGDDSFTYKANDGDADSSIVTVSITVTPVNDAPVALPQTVFAVEDALKDITLTGSDVDGDALTFTVATPPAHGTLSGVPPDLKYMPAANYNGPDSFTFKANDGFLDSNVATVAITVSPVNDAPVAVNDSYPLTLPSLTVSATSGVLANDRDVESSTLTAEVVSGPSKGTLLLSLDGSFTYTPRATIGSDSFTYRASDGSLTSNVATVTITAYALVGTQNVPPATVSKVKAGATQPMKWQFKDETTVVNSSAVHHAVTIKGGSIYKEYKDTDPGSSSFRYDSTTNTWYFNLQTKDTNGVPYPSGDYLVTITPTTSGYLPSLPFKLTLTK